ncbi:hypothetical protein [Streptomyces sp. NPDC000229]|uniref:hypothetical protein n=1 Tax=Streptomyces sp. NPDC000229 TaxID=3154247 RepID=UPI004037D042
MTIRRATADDVLRVKAVTEAAYQHYIARIGRVPAPMAADHAADVAAGHLEVPLQHGAAFLGV